MKVPFKITEMNYLLMVVLIMLIVPVSEASSQSYGGFTLYSKMNSTKAFLLDSAGTVYHEWTFPSNRRTAYSTYMEPGGTLVRSVSGTNSSFWGAAALSVAVQKVDWDGNVVWHFPYSTSDYVLHHDICPMPDGNVLVTAYERMTALDVTQAGCTLNSTMYFEKIMEVQPTGASTGNIVWEWRVFDHLVQDVDSTKDNYVTNTADHPHKFNVNYKAKRDWMHINSLDYNPELDQVLFSARYMGEVYVIDKSTTTAQAAGNTGGNSGKGGGLLYRWGNPEAYGVTGTQFIDMAHDIHIIPHGFPYAGYISFFNNKGGTGGKTCVDIILPPSNGYLFYHTPGTPYAPATYTWRHTYSGNPDNYMGGAQPLENGNFLVTLPSSGHIYEVDSADNVVWSVTLGGSIPKARRYSKPWVENTLGITSPEKQLSWKLYPNPTNGAVNVAGLEEGTNLLITDMIGKTRMRTVKSGTLDLTGMPPGIYLVTIPDIPSLKGVRVVLRP